MSHHGSRFHARTAAEVGSCFKSTELARCLLEQNEQSPPLAYFELLLDRGMWADAVDFLAHGLSARDSVWWGCLCIRHVRLARLDEQESAALFRAGSWVVQGTAAARELVKSAAAEVHDQSSPVRLVALAAAAGNGESSRTAHNIAAAIKMLAGSEAVLGELLVIGLAIAEGKHSWETHS
ncbi:MAG: hypothetical protein AB7K24_17550 [Gemmataceae bacterium]